MNVIYFIVGLFTGYYIAKLPPTPPKVIFDVRKG